MGAGTHLSEKKRDFARDGRAGTRETMPSPRVPPSVLSPFSFVRALELRSFFFSFFTGAFRRFEGKKRWLQFEEITFGCDVAFSFQKKFVQYPSHRIFGRMYGALNTVEKNN